VGQSEKKISPKSHRQLHQLLLTTAVGGALIAVPQMAKAAPHTLTGAHTTTQTVADDNATVTTDNTFSVTNVTTGDALDIYGAGTINYDDLGNNNNLMTTIAGNDGLNITSLGDFSGPPSSAGSIAVTSGGTISGGANGIDATNYGTGNTSITTTGTVTGTSSIGIYAINNNSSAGYLNVSAATVTGYYNGIYAENDGTGDTSVSASGLVTGTNGDGINIKNTTNNTGELNVTSANVTGTTNGIEATNNGIGNTIIDSTGGTVTGTNNVGIYALGANNGGVGGGNVTINAAVVNGGVTGISAENDGTGDVSVTATGTVTGTTTQGIYAYANNANAGDLTVNAVDITAGTNGVYAQNKGLGITQIITTGTVSGTSTDGIYAYTNNALNNKDLTVNAVNATGGKFGIVASNSGIGNTSVTTTGTVTGNTIDGIYAVNSNAAGAGTLTVNALDVTGYSGGIYAENDGIGNTSVTTTGAVNVSHGNGMDVYAYNNSGAGNGTLTVSVNDVSASYLGINAVNSGTGATSVTTSGEVQGGAAGIKISAVSTTNLTTVTVNNTSHVHNSSNNSAALAVQITGASGGTANIANNGLIKGYALLSNENDTFDNNGSWNSSGGTSDFGAGNDVINNNNGGDFFAYNGTGSSVTQVNGIETVNSNTGSAIVMQDGQVGDSLTFTNGGNGVFHANGGILSVDTNIVPQTSDVLHVDNVTTGIDGSTGVNVNVVNGLGQPTTGNGVLIVDVANTSSKDAFVLSSPITAGLYDYHLNLVGDPGWYLQSNARPDVVANGVLPILGSRAALSTLSNLNDRQRDVDVLSNNNPSQKGVWGRAFGQTNDFNGKGYDGFGFNTHLWGAQAGIDLKASGDQTGNRKYAGLYVAYASSTGDAQQYGHDVASLDLNATTIGAYYTKYSANNWYLDAVAQYSFLNGIHAKTSTDDSSPSGKSYALSLEAGRKYKPDSNIIRELQVQLIDQYTDVDDVTLNDDTQLNLSSLNAVTGRVGLRLYGNPNKSGKSFLPWLRANIWHTFSGDSTISSLGSSINTPIGGTSGELEMGFSKGHAQSGGWGIYGSAGYLFDISGAEYSGWKGTLGLRKGW
jgi:autotransporter family porin